ncbi:CPBP family intramembrane metalloprotease [Streptomyces sp. ISL-22]|uniref:CPBP family glutamic-type intramembrane protease n=1 Tax=unclassified Streptomyces TaxID=2593676 RepID=UPI001BE79F9C|nr:MULTISPECIES: CPBP family glutamic-type intramembrane protease [unclassified Streptomyces]MBT2423437.1 CPBP family intramembrane metalloprotease [Streptomyces sp. ISL-24]MBT2438420.1 CPBP family intramembrane metalloprotease [Streptomyces sp. ISL-22]
MLVVAAFVLAYGWPTIAAVQVLLTGRVDVDLPDWIEHYLLGGNVMFLVAAAAMLLAHRWLGYTAGELGFGARPCHPFPLSGLGAAAVAYLAMWIGFQVMLWFPSPTGHQFPDVSLVDRVVGDARAALVEESLLLALPVAVMTRLRWTWPAQLAVLIALRLPFHVYYGYGAIALALIWVSGYLFVYRRTQLVWPFMLAHFLYNAASGDYVPPFLRFLMGLVFTTTGVVLVIRLGRHRRTHQSVPKSTREVP